ncbi:hypothetical protein ACFSKW_29455 [Nonomuraea mangrovi]|uniref:Uncharacterized protein n=1 Tax=Nonomuraea mangrovi TaxID=2316207 RepID=A0ABW4T2Y5_9ACTN
MATIPAGVDGDQADVEPPTGWENELGEPAGRVTRLANTVSGSARDHQAVTADWRHATRIAGIRRMPSSSLAGDESPISP